MLKPSRWHRTSYHDAGLTINFARGGDDHHAGLGRLSSAELADEALDTLITAGEPAVRNQVLPDGHGVAAPGESELDRFPVGLAGARGRAALGARQPWFCRLVGRSRQAGVGGHRRFIGRFCCRRRRPPPTPGWPRLDSGGSQVSGRSLSTHTGRPLDPPQRPAKPSQCYDLLFLFLAQDIAHADREVKLSSESMSWVSVSLAAFQVTINGRFWVIPEAYDSEAASYPKSIIYGVIGPPDGVDLFHRWSHAT